MRMGVRTAIVAVALMVSAPGVAHATTWCVKDPTCPPGGNASQTTIQGAVTAAAPTGDLILIGPGKFNESVSVGIKAVDFAGAGEDRTVIQSPTPGTTTLAGGLPGTVEDLGIELPSTSGTGLSFNGTATRVAVTAPAGFTSGTGVTCGGCTFDDGSVTLPLGVTDFGIAQEHGPSGAVQDSTITAEVGLVGIRTVGRDRVLATQGLRLDNGTIGGNISTSYTVDDTVVQTAPGTIAETAISSVADSTASANLQMIVTIRHCTLVGSGASTATGLSVASSGTTVSGNVGTSATLDDSIVAGYGTAIARHSTGGGGGATAFALVTTDYSDFDHAKQSSVSDGSPAGTGEIDNGAHDVGVAPAFVNTVFGDPQAFHLLASSPLIDAGSDALSDGESPTDVADGPRFIAGTVGGKAISDIGAVEFQPHAPSVSVAAGGPVAVGHVATFTASGNDPDPGDSLTFSWHFDDGATATGPSVSHAFATGRVHTATVTVTDLSGSTATATARVTVIAVPSISQLAVKSAISYRDSQPATTTFTVSRIVTGVKRHGHCVAHGHGRHCTLLQRLGSFRATDVAGTNRVALPGRVGGHRLIAATYELSASPRNMAGTGKTVVTRFRVRR